MHVVRESIFVSAIRSFFNALLAMVGVIIGFGVLVGLSLSFSTPIQGFDSDVAMEFMPSGKDDSSLMRAESSPVILHLDFDGVIGDGSLTGDTIEKFLRVSRTGLFKNDRVKAIILHIDSPGGAVFDSDNIYRALMAYKEAFKVPIYTYTSGLCASGGYYIACASDKIFSSPIAIVGSVGVVMGPHFNVYELMEKHGITATVVTDGKNKVKFPMFTKLPEGKDRTASYDDFIQISNEFYNRFVDIVVGARNSKGLTKPNLINNLGAQVYTGPTAQKLGYIDNGNSSYKEALQELAKVANIDFDNCQVVRFYQKKSPLQELVTNKLDLMLSETKSLLFGVPSFGKWKSEFLYYHSPTSR